MRDTNQIMRFNGLELDLIKSLFSENEELLFLIRKVLLQFELTERENLILKNSINEDTYQLLRKTFLPEIDSEAPLFQLSDMRVALKNDLTAKDVDGMGPLFEAKKLEIDYLNQQFKILEGLESNPSQKIKLSDMARLDGDKYQNYVNLTAWNYLMTYIDSYINELRNLANLKKETQEETIKRLRRNSAK